MTLGRPYIIVVPVPKTSKETQTVLGRGKKNLKLGWEGNKESDWERSGAEYVQIAFYEILQELIILLK